MLNNGEVISTAILNNKAKIIDFIHIFELNNNIISITYKPHLEKLYQFMTEKILGHDVSFSNISHLNTLTINYGNSLMSEHNACISENGITTINIDNKYEFVITSKNIPNESDSTEIEFTDWRIKNALPWHGFEIIQTRNPYQCGLNKYVHENKGCYTGQEVLTRMRSRKKGMKKLYIGSIKDKNKQNITTQGSTNFLGITSD